MEYIIIQNVFEVSNKNLKFYEDFRTIFLNSEVVELM